MFRTIRFRVHFSVRPRDRIDRERSQLDRDQSRFESWIVFAKGEIPCADHIKLDCEGFEVEILMGGRQYLRISGVLSAVVETNFNISPILPQTHFAAVLSEMLKHRLVVADYSFDRVAQPSYVQALFQEPWPEPDVRRENPPFTPGSPATHNFLFCRDFVGEPQAPYQPPPEKPLPPLTVDRLIKTMICFELHGLMDWAYVHAEMFAGLLASRLDVEKAKRLLLAPPRELRYSPDLVRCLQMIDELRVLLFESESKLPSLAKVSAWELATEARRRITKWLFGLS
jgi:hypothetical protein